MFFPTLIGVSIAIFVLMRVIPGDVAALILGGPEGEGTYTLEDLENLREQMGLNDPIYVQYGRWVRDLTRGDLGDSIALGRPIAGEIKRQFPDYRCWEVIKDIILLRLNVCIARENRLRQIRNDVIAPGIIN